MQCLKQGYSCKSTLVSKNLEVHSLMGKAVFMPCMWFMFVFWRAYFVLLINHLFLADVCFFVNVISTHWFTGEQTLWQAECYSSQSAPEHIMPIGTGDNAWTNNASKTLHVFSCHDLLHDICFTFVLDVSRQTSF